MTAAQFIDAAKKALDEFGECGLGEKYWHGTSLSTAKFTSVTHATEMEAEEWWQCFVAYCGREGEEIM